MVTLDYQVSASADDGQHLDSGSGFLNNNAVLRIGRYNSSRYYITFVRFVGFSIPAGATIDVAYAQFLGCYAYGDVKIYFEKANNPTAISSGYDTRTRTTNYATWTLENSAGWVTTPSLVDCLSELLALYSMDNVAVQMIIVGDLGNSYYTTPASYDASGNVSGPKLHIEYTEQAAGSLVFPSRRRSFQGLIGR